MRFLVLCLLAACLLAACLLAACSSNIPFATTPATIKTPDRAWASTVRLEVYCDGEREGLGSGVAISRRHIMTALHVVDCGKKEFTAAEAHLPNGRRLWAVMDALPKSEGVDAARLVLAGIEQFETYSPLAFYSPAQWQTVCVLASDVEMGELYPKCGYVSRTTKATLRVSIHVVPGNSGSAVWDEQGRVVAIVSRGRWASAGEFVLVAQRLGVAPELLLPATHPDLH